MLVALLLNIAQGQVSAQPTNSAKIIQSSIKKSFLADENKTGWNYQHLFLRYLNGKYVNMTNLQVGYTITTPFWLNNAFHWWLHGQISDEEYIREIQYLTDNKIITTTYVNETEVGQEKRDLAIKLAINSTLFQSMAKGYNYKVENGMYYQPLDIIENYSLQFALYKGDNYTGYNTEKVIVVVENPKLNTILSITESAPFWNGVTR